MKVRNMTGRTGKGIANQFIIEIERGFTTWEVFQSYQTPVAIKDDHILQILNISRYRRVALTNDWDCSVTTAKYVAQFLRMSTKEIREEIKAKRIVVYSRAGFKRLIKDPGQIEAIK